MSAVRTFVAALVIGAAVFAGACNIGTPPLPKAEADAIRRAPRAREGQVYRSSADHLVVGLPTGWRIMEERGALVLVSDSAPAPRNTIAIKAVRLGDYPARTERRNKVLPGTKALVEGLPGVDEITERPATVGKLTGNSFHFTFTPPNREGYRYEREHAVLVGETTAYHVIGTSPSGDLAKTEAVFKAVLASLKEEV